ncbi:MAG TPA: hypothetical protein VNM67_14705 [Thermoanaerobaculia bacterium]|jgi:hypothetical protein|nr:hypothetical protein [Thermoanaerobaculia bacterium]
MAPLVAHVQLCEAKGEGGDKLRIRSWVEVELVGMDDSPIPNEPYEIELPGGKLVKGKLNGQGKVRLEGIPPGRCRVSFPGLDKSAWTPTESQSGQP